MFGFGPESVDAAFPSWIAAGAAALLVIVVCTPLAARRVRRGAPAAIRSFLLVACGALACGVLTWAFFDSAAIRDRSAERRMLEMRAQQLAAQALVPGSPLACLDGLAGDTVQSACKQALFATPENVAAATSYVSAEFVLLSDMTDYLRRGGTGIDAALVPLRRALEADPFGFLAHVLARRDGCTGQTCPALSLLPDAGQVRTNLIAQTLQSYVEDYRDAWAKLPGLPVAQSADGQPGGMAGPGAASGRKAVADIDFPTAASIPPISIMNPEPKVPARQEPPREHPGLAQTEPVWTPARDPRTH
jgi:hypothetical protein